MKRVPLINILLLLFLVQINTSFPQLTPTEIDKRKEIEEFLKTAEIVKHKDIGHGVTKPIKLYLKQGEIEKNGCWKNVKGRPKGFLEGWQYEIAAYEMDKLLGLNMVPPTVERKFKGKRGSLQLWVYHQFSDLEMREQGLEIPNDKTDHWSKMKYLARAFDSLIANEDRTQQNYLYTKDWQTILIDHSRSFRSSRKFTKKLVSGKYAEGRPKPFRRLPRNFVEKIRALDYDSIKKAVGPYLKDKEIKAILIRKELILKEIDEMIKEKGEDNVLY